MVWYDPPPLVGHVAIVVGVNPPLAGHNGSVTFAEANGPGSIVTQTLLPDLSVVDLVQSHPVQRAWLHQTCSHKGNWNASVMLDQLKGKLWTRLCEYHIIVHTRDCRNAQERSLEVNILSHNCTHTSAMPSSPASPISLTIWKEMWSPLPWQPAPSSLPGQLSCI